MKILGLILLAAAFLIVSMGRPPGAALAIGVPVGILGVVALFSGGKRK